MENVTRKVFFVVEIIDDEYWMSNDELWAMDNG